MKCKICGTGYNAIKSDVYCSKECAMVRIREDDLRRKFPREYGLYRAYKLQDKKRNFANDLDVPFIYSITGGKSCSYCGRTNGLGLDRIDNKRGHTKDNVVPACGKCNKFRGDYLTVQETKKVIDFIRSFREW